MLQIEQVVARLITRYPSIPPVDIEKHSPCPSPPVPTLPGFGDYVKRAGTAANAAVLSMGWPKRESYSPQPAELPDGSTSSRRLPARRRRPPARGGNLPRSIRSTIRVRAEHTEGGNLPERKES